MIFLHELHVIFLPAVTSATVNEIVLSQSSFGHGISIGNLSKLKLLVTLTPDFAISFSSLSTIMTGLVINRGGRMIYEFN